MYSGIGLPSSIIALILAWARSRATTSVPVNESRVFTGCFESSAKTAAIGWFKSMATTSSLRCSSVVSGKNCAGSRSNSSRKIPSLVILAFAWRSAEQETAIAMGSDAPWRGKRTTRTSWQKYLPPNCAPIPKVRVSSRTFCSNSTSRKPWPVAASPEVGKESKYLVLASFAVFTVCSALVPPMTIAK